MNQSEIREQNIRNVLLISRDLFLENGVSKTSINSIAERCGLSPMSIYRYFRNKDSLAYAVWCDSLTEFYDQYFMPEYLRIAHDLKTGYEKFLSCINVYIKFYQEHPEWFSYTREMFEIATRVNGTQTEEQTGSKDMDDYRWTGFFREIPTPVLKALAEGVEDGSIRQDINIYEVYQVFVNVYTGPMLFDYGTTGVSTMGILKYTTELLGENIRSGNHDATESPFAREA